MDNLLKELKTAIWIAECRQMLMDIAMSRLKTAVEAQGKEVDWLRDQNMRLNDTIEVLRLEEQSRD